MFGVTIDLPPLFLKKSCTHSNVITVANIEFILILLFELIAVLSFIGWTEFVII